jgi:hypothetical protein
MLSSANDRVSASPFRAPASRPSVPAKRASHAQDVYQFGMMTGVIPAILQRATSTLRSESRWIGRFSITDGSPIGRDTANRAGSTPPVVVLEPVYVTAACWWRGAFIASSAAKGHVVAQRSDLRRPPACRNLPAWNASISMACGGEPEMALIRPSPPRASRAATSRCRHAIRNSSWVQQSLLLGRGRLGWGSSWPPERSGWWVEQGHRGGEEFYWGSLIGSALGIGGVLALARWWRHRDRDRQP